MFAAGASLWRRLPAVLRGAIAAFVILSIGQIPPGVFLTLGLRFTPAIPWFLLGTAAWLAVFWWYVAGGGSPVQTQSVRRRRFQGGSISIRTWMWALVAGGLGMASVLSGALLTGLVADLPAAAYEAPFDLTPFPTWTVVSYFVQVAIVAAVVEEAAFRGYMLSMVRERHGIVIAIATVAILFWLVHLGHAYATPAFIPFFAAYSALHGLLVYYSGSIRPSIVLHAAGDLTILPMQYGVVRDPLGAAVGPHVAAVLGFGLGAIFVFVLWRRGQSALRAAASRARI